MKIHVRAIYSTNTNAPVDIDVESWEEVESWYVKWGVFHYKTKGKWEEIDMESNDLVENLDMSRPSWVEIYSSDKDGDCDYEETLDESHYKGDLT